ncbi:hypothetical protein P154DRAFT_498638 [Amniculicola lignicola CBS 123094]|uniref:Rhodopsin domain-containing protein n=1 Tax=Amniculicola lignicola CBS 123094 TaxID=1392246 RepID=A0A6A5W3E2_9PLEO|nr:hypothetical protein P154DRAFT_498638 [Amniculicola lignicola CBS 123094]
MSGDAVALLAHADLFKRAGGLTPPPEVALSWPAPNYINPETKGWGGPIVLMVVLGITATIFSARVWARVVVARNAGLDDLLMGIAMVPLIGLTVATILANRQYGFQWHSWDQTATTFVTSRQIALVIEILYLTSTSLIKISILCFYRRITSGSISKVFVYWVWGSIVFVIVYCITFIFTIVFSCVPVEGYWHMFDLAWRLKHELKCHNEGAEIVSVVVISTLQDFVICALPIVLVWNLQIPRRQKAALIGIFGLGLLTCVCGIMRTYYAIYVYYFTYDITWWANPGWVWTALEADLGVICASAPALKIFFRRYFNLSANRSNGYGNSYQMKNRTPTFGSKLGSKISSKISAGKGNSNIDSGRWGASSPAPMEGIKISRGLDVTIEQRDDGMYHGDSESVKGLTALPSPAYTPKNPLTSWLNGSQSQTICTAYRSDSSASGGSRRERDIERGPG